MKSLQEMFNEVEENLQTGLESFAVNCEYKVLMKTITQLDDAVFEMLYDDDTENADSYELSNVNLELEHEKLRKITE